MKQKAVLKKSDKINKPLARQNKQKTKKFQKTQIPTSGMIPVSLRTLQTSKR